LELLSVLQYADDMVLLSPSKEELVVMLQVMDKGAASPSVVAKMQAILRAPSIDKEWKQATDQRW